MKHLKLFSLLAISVLAFSCENESIGFSHENSSKIKHSRVRCTQIVQNTNLITSPSNNQFFIFSYGTPSCNITWNTTLANSQYAILNFSHNTSSGWVSLPQVFMNNTGSYQFTPVDFGEYKVYVIGHDGCVYDERIFYLVQD